MRARAGLASTLLRLGDPDVAVAHYRDMLKGIVALCVADGFLCVRHR
jgi:hypothetical protein